MREYPANKRAIDASMEEELNKLVEEAEEALSAYKWYKENSGSYVDFLMELMDVDHVLDELKHRIGHTAAQFAKSKIVAKNEKRGDYILSDVTEWKNNEMS